MGIVLNVNDNGTQSVLEVANENASVVEITNTTTQLNITNPTSAVVIEVLKGQPGVQNLYVGPTPPNNPEEGWIWIQT